MTIDDVWALLLHFMFWVAVVMTLQLLGRWFVSGSKRIWSDDDVREMQNVGHVAGPHERCYHRTCMSLRWRFMTLDLGKSR